MSQDLPIGKRVRAIPARSINEGVWAARELRSRPMFGVDDSVGGSGESSDDTKRARVYDNLAGATPSDGKVTIPKVTCLYEKADDGGWVADTDGDTFEAEPLFGVALTLAETGCCDTDGSTPPAGLAINPVMDNYYITDSDDTAVVVSGTGATRTNTVTVTIDGSGTAVVESSIAVNADGTWTSGSLDVTGLDKGVLSVTAAESPNPSASVTVGVAYETDEPADTFDGQPPAPDLVAGSDLGSSDTDNITSDDTPTFDITFGGMIGPPDPAGPKVLLVRDGVVVDSSGSYVDFDSQLTIQRTSVALADGVHVFQVVYEIDGPGATVYYSPASLPLYLTVDEDEDSEATDSNTYCRRCLVKTINGVLTITEVDKCRMAASQAEIDKLSA